MNVTLKTTYKIVKYILVSKEFTQTEIHQETNSSLGRINKVVNWLLTRKFLEKTEGKYHVIDPAGIVSIFPLYRTMNELLAYRIPLRDEKETILKHLPKESILCFDSALDAYSRYSRSSRICLYHEEPELLKKIFEPYRGGIIDLEIYHPDMDLQEDVENGQTSKLRTVIDMTCDGKTYLAKDLFEQLWDIKFG
ncbi:MAG: hypothetical protein WC525_03995 [Candidatus Thermoplasmatota archaeon]